jgi:ATP-dependent helicase/nuclease subunit B
MVLNVTAVQGLSPSRLRDRLLAEFRRGARASIGAALWIGPTAEAVDEARQQLPALDSSGAILGPLMFDWGGLADYIVRRLDPSCRIITSERRRLLLHEVILELRQKKLLAYFDRYSESHGFFDSLFGMLAEFAEANIAPEILATADFGPAGRELKKKEMALIIEQYQTRLRLEGRLDTAATLPFAVRLLKNAKRRPFEKVNAVFVDGVNAISPVRLSLLQQIGGKTSRIFVAMPGEANGARNELFQQPRAIIEAIRQAFASVDVITLDDDPTPAGLHHLRRTLFSETIAQEQSPDTAGLSSIEAAGTLSEVRLVARRIRILLSDARPAKPSLFDETVRPEQILVVARRLDDVRDVLAEVFDDYQVSIDMEGGSSSAPNPQAKAFIRAARLADVDWPFAGTTALLRNGLFFPAWPECDGDLEMPRHAEALLRMLGEPRGRANVLRAVDIWADSPPEGLEDEGAEEPRRLKIIRLAKRCRPFLNRFYGAWDRLPLRASPSEFVGALRDFADDLGFQVNAGAEGRSSLHSLWLILGLWATGWRKTREPLSRADFFQQIETLSIEEPESRRSLTGRVRIRSAESAAALQADFVFLIGLGEKTYPNLSPPDSLLDDVDRRILEAEGLRSPASSEERLPGEMLLFHRLVALPRKELILSYAAVDERGQRLLPSTFLRAVRDCFTDRVIPVEHQRMPIEGYAKRRPISAGEWRVQFAAAMNKTATDAGKWKHPRLAPDLTANLQDAARMARRRFRSDDFNQFDGWLEQPKIVRDLNVQFGPAKTFSPTALESYVACPFRFFLGSVLGLEPLEEPIEDVETTRRGSAIHRALARFHEKLLRESGAGPTPAATAELQRQIAAAVLEYQERAPTQAAKVLWGLEGKRLQRVASRYAKQWRKFIDNWAERNALPVPARLEAEFGLQPSHRANEVEHALTEPALTIDVNGIEVRIGGRIDRVDVTELPEGIGFWVIDYKTGNPLHYSIGALVRFEKLQLGLYALAVEKSLFAGQKARPLGLAYWLVTDQGPKGFPDGKQRFSWLDAPEQWQRFREQLEAWVAELVRNIRSGHFPLAPRSPFCTDTCHFGQVCRIAQSRRTSKVWNLPLPVLS